MELKATINPTLIGSTLRMDVELSAGDDLRRSFYARVVELEDATIRAALIKLGWTPPPLEA